MNRRDFVHTLMATAAAAAFDPERHLWLKKKTIFIPPTPKHGFLYETADREYWYTTATDSTSVTYIVTVLAIAV